MTTSTCPDQDLIRAYAAGKLADANLESVDNHIGECLECQAVLETLDESPDTLVDRLRSGQATDPFQNESECRRVTAEAAAIASLPAAGAGAPHTSQSQIDPERLGDYQIVARLGEGGMGSVFKARHARLDKIVALKVLSKGRTGDPNAVARFEREMKAVGKISHPNIVQALDARDVDGRVVLVMEFADGLDVGEVVRRVGPLNVADACEIVRQTALGLQTVHKNGMVHRDIKPSNLMLAHRGAESDDGGSQTASVKILDLGLALLDCGLDSGAANHEVTDAGQIMGTADYMAPEQASDSHRVDIRADIYSLGCTLYKLLSGKAPFSGPRYEYPMKKMLAHMQASVQPVGQLRPEVPKGLAAALDRMLAKDPEARYATPADLAAAVAPFAKGCDLEHLLLEAERRLPAASPSRFAPSQSRADEIATQSGALRPMPAGFGGGLARRRRSVAVAAAAVFALVLMAVVIKMRSSDGTLIVELADSDATVEVHDDQGKIVVQPRKADGKKIEISVVPGKGTLLVQQNGVEVFSKDFTLKSGGREIISARWEPASASAPPQRGKIIATWPAVLHTIPWVDAEQQMLANIFQTGISEDGKLFFAAGDAGPTGIIRLFDIATGKEVQRLVPHKDVWFSYAALVPGGKYLAAGYTLDNDVYLWNLATGTIVRKFVGHTEGEIGVAASPDGKRILSWSKDGTLRLWDVETGKQLNQLEGHAERAEGLFSPDGKLILTYGAGKPLLSPDGKLTLTYGADKTLRLWSAQTCKELKKLEGRTASPRGTFSPDGKQVLSFDSDGIVQLWDVASGRPVRRYEGTTGKVDRAYFVADGKKVAATSQGDRTFRMWETGSGKLVQQIDLNDLGGDAWSMSASPDGRLGLVSDEVAGAVRVYDLASGQEIHTYAGCPKARAFSFTPDGKLAVAGSFRSALYVFRFAYCETE